jgi:hypothetical protein
LEKGRDVGDPKNSRNPRRELVAERRVPNDKLLMWLLARLDPKRFALPWEQRGNADPQSEVAGAFPALLDSITDVVS